MASLVRYDAEGRGALGEQRLRTILSDMGLEPETVAAEKLASRRSLAACAPQAP
jgi:DNA anti-recombination protein RmuC